MRPAARLAVCGLLAALLLAAPDVRGEEEAGEPGADAKDAAAVPDAEADPAELVAAREGEVAVLTDRNANATLREAKLALVLFYSPDCEHSQRLLPMFSRAADKLKGTHPDVLLAKVNCTRERGLFNKYKIQHFPTMKLFRGGELAAEYPSFWERNTRQILEYVDWKAGDALFEAESLDDLEAHKASSSVQVLGFFKELKGAEYEAYQAFAEKNFDRYELISLLETTNATVAEAVGLTSAPGFVVSRTYDGFDAEVVPAASHPAFAEGDAPLVERLEGLVEAERLPPFVEYRKDDSDIFTGTIRKLLVTSVNASLVEPGTDLRQALVAASKAFRGKLTFLVVKLEEGVPSMDAHELLRTFNLNIKPETQVVGYDVDTKAKYMFEGSAVSVEALEEFGRSMLAGTAKRVFMSAPIPKNTTDNGIVAVVGTTVDPVVRNPAKDVLLLLYTPWCQHSMVFEPVYQRLAKRFAKVGSVVIARMDSSANEHAAIDVKETPTLLFFPAQEGAEPILYEGDRSLLDLTRFIKRHAKVPFELPKKQAAAKQGEQAAKGHEEL